jgi:crotonobetainyl-CoA:carnitine CoA-transferase CaiB-like acyl-CoA transferase
MMLGDLGADVIKVEDLAGDSTRGIGLGNVFAPAVNRSKRALCLDVRAEEGRAIIRRLVAGADVFMHSARPGAQERSGLGPDDLMALNERLVYASVSGFGEVGPDATRGGVDFIVQAESGMMSITGMPDGPPTKAGFQVVDYATGMALCQAVLAALYRRERTGKGERVTVNLLNTALHLQGVQLAEYGIRGAEPERPGNSVAHVAPAELLWASDGALMLVASAPAQWRALCEVVGDPGLADDVRFASNDDRLANRAELAEVLRARFATRTRVEWAEALGARGVLVGQVKGYDDVLADDHIARAGMVVDLQLADGRHIPLVRTPMELASSPVVMRRPPPALGEHSMEVLCELGMEEAEIDGLVAAGLVRQGSG